MFADEMRTIFTIEGTHCFDRLTCAAEKVVNLLCENGTISTRIQIDNELSGQDFESFKRTYAYHSLFSKGVALYRNEFINFMYDITFSTPVDFHGISVIREIGEI